MSLNQRSELCKLREGQENPREKQDLLEELLFGAEEDVAAAVAPSPPQSPQGVFFFPSAMEAVPCSRSEVEGSSSRDEEGPSSCEYSGAQFSLQDTLCFKMIDLVGFLLWKYSTKELITKAEILSSVIREHQDHFPEIFSRAAECLQVVFGIDVLEVDSINHIYVQGITLGLTYDGVDSDGHSMPKTGLLVMVLCVILMEGECAPEHKVWEVLNNMGLYDGMQHYIFGEPRELLTKVWVEEQYIEYRQVTDSDPARYEFLWGPRAHAETTQLKVLDFMFKVNIRTLSFIPFLLRSLRRA